ncbi:MAG TPA: S41 family peptidase [Candidatus Faecivicinus avistercoris]|nr:S41 family peptidase [Candidatus Faecivicinus avistercoris]
MKRRVVIITAVVWMLVIVAVASSALTALVLSGSDGGSALRVVGEDEYEIIDRYRRLDEVRATLMNEYYQPLDEDELVLGAIRGMMSAVGDPYTFYYTADEMTAANEEFGGVYHGVGMLVQLTDDGAIEVARVYEDSPAEAAGVRMGDRIVAVDGVEVSGESAQTLNEAIDRIQGEDGTTVVLSVQRDGEILDLEVMRAEVSISYVEYQIINGDIGYINISQFSGNDVEGFQEAMSALQAAEVSGVIIDIRNNPGGLLTDVVEIADALLPEGLIAYVEDGHGNRTEYTSDADYWDVPLVVMVNGMSASASELLSAAIQDYDRGTIVGTTTYGKGIVQTLITFAEDGAGMQLTTASYYSPSGRSIHENGVEPDVTVELSEDCDLTVPSPNLENDNQLAAALEALQARIDAASEE